MLDDVLLIDAQRFKMLYKGEIPEYLETFKITLRDLHGHNIRNSSLARIPEWGKRTSYYRYISDWTTLPKGKGSALISQLL